MNADTIIKPMFEYVLATSGVLKGKPILRIWRHPEVEKYRYGGYVFSSESGEQFQSFQPNLVLLSDVSKNNHVLPDFESYPIGCRMARESAESDWRRVDNPFSDAQKQDLLAYLKAADKRRDAEMERNNQESAAKDLRGLNPPENK